MEVLTPTIHILYNSKDITKDISPSILSISYTDHHGYKDDTLDIELENQDLRWLSDWIPKKGDTLKVSIGYKNSPLLDCGLFQIEQLEFSAPPDKLRISAISSSIKHSLRTRRTKAYQNTSLFQIATEIAKRHNLKPILQGKDIPFKRLDQLKKSDLAFLNDLAQKYGFNFKIVGDKLVLIELERLEALAPIKTIARRDCLTYTITDKTRRIYRACEVRYWDAKEHKEKKYVYELENVSGEILRVEERVENLQQAIQMAKAMLKKRNYSETRVNLELIGDTSLVAGLTISLEGFGFYDGKYLIESSTHTVTPEEGYKTSLEVVRCLE